jgi:hypothetical protein
MSQPVTNGSQWCIFPIEYRGQTSQCISAKTTGGMLAPALLRPQQRRFAGTRSLVGIGRLAALILTVLESLTQKPTGDRFGVAAEHHHRQLTPERAGRLLSPDAPISISKIRAAFAPKILSFTLRDDRSPLERGCPTPEGARFILRKVNLRGDRRAAEKIWRVPMVRIRLPPAGSLRAFGSSSRSRSDDRGWPAMTTASGAAKCSQS